MEDVIFIIKDRKTVSYYMVVSDDFINDPDVMHRIGTLTGYIKGHSYSWISLSSLNNLDPKMRQYFPYYREVINIVDFLIDGGELL